MPRAEILSTQAMHTLRQLHAELGGKLIDRQAEVDRLTTAMTQVEAVMKLLQPGYDVRPIAVRRRRPMVQAWHRQVDVKIYFVTDLTGNELKRSKTASE